MYGRVNKSGSAGNSSWLLENLRSSPVRCWSASDLEIFAKFGGLSMNEDKENIGTEQNHSNQQWTVVFNKKQKKVEQTVSTLL